MFSIDWSERNNYLNKTKLHVPIEYNIITEHIIQVLLYFYICCNKHGQTKTLIVWTKEHKWQLRFVRPRYTKDVKNIIFFTI